MATFKLGAIITDIAGSIGGTTLKRNGTSSVMMNKVSGGSKNIKKINAQLNSLKYIFQRWSQMTDAQRLRWNNTALLFQFPDKFGTMRTITGRQLYTKLSSQLLPVNREVADIAFIHSNTSDFTLENFNIELNPTHAELQIQNLGAEAIFIVQVEVSQKKLLLPQFTRRKIIAFMIGSDALGFDITDALITEYPYLSQFYKVRAYVTSMNIYGFRSATKYIDANLFYTPTPPPVV